MNKLSKIFLIINIILVISLIVMTSLYFNMREVARLNYTLYQHATEQVNELETEINKNNNI